MSKSLAALAALLGCLVMMPHAYAQVAPGAGVTFLTPPVANDCVKAVNSALIADSGSPCGAGSGTVTIVSVTTNAGVSGTVATATTTPAIILTLGAITPTSVHASSSIDADGALLSGANSGNAGALGLFGSGTGEAIIQAPAAAGSVTLTTPTTSGTIATTAYVDTSCKLPGAIASTGNTFTAPCGQAVCTAACTITPPTPVFGQQFCVWNDTNTTGVITLAAISGVQYENTSRASYKTANTSLASVGAVGDLVCIVGRDSTHYQTLNFNGTWS